MAEYIKKALVAREIRKLLRVRESAVDIFQAGFEYGVDRAWVKINEIPAADVAPVVHGRWVDKWKCSACGEISYEEAKSDETDPNCYYVLSDYCPNCGARMDIDEEGE